jgi:hypothetical protein
MKYRVGSTIKVKKVETVRPKIIESHNDVHVGLERVRGIIQRTVQIEVKNTGSKRVFTASIILSLNSISSFIFAFILSKRIIQFLTTIQNNATSQINQGNESGCQNKTSHMKTQINESGIVASTRIDCL